jgi:Stage II sporulation protein E (SpoIIE)
VSDGWSFGGSILTFAFPMLLFIGVAVALYIQYTKPAVVPWHRHSTAGHPVSYTAIPGTPTATEADAGVVGGGNEADAGVVGGGSGAGPVAVSLVCAGHPLPLLLREAGAGVVGGGNEAAAGVVGGENEAAAGVVGGDNEAGAGAEQTGEAPLPPVPAARPQILLGVEDDVTFEADEILLYPGDALLTVTDGVTERRDDAGRLLDDDNGLAQVLATCRGLSALAMASRIQRAVRDFGTEPSYDDMAILVLRARPAAPVLPAPPALPAAHSQSRRRKTR